MSRKGPGRTPIEMAIDLAKGDRRLRWEEAKRKAGFKRVNLRVHEDDEARLRAYAARLLKARGTEGD